MSWLKAIQEPAFLVSLLGVFIELVGKYAWLEWTLAWQCVCVRVRIVCVCVCVHVCAHVCVIFCANLPFHACDQPIEQGGH